MTPKYFSKELLKMTKKKIISTFKLIESMKKKIQSKNDKNFPESSSSLNSRAFHEKINCKYNNKEINIKQWKINFLY